MKFLARILSAIFTGHMRTDAYLEGSAAYYAGSAEINPYWIDTPRHDQWNAGYRGR